jgi:hypothetical protein
MAAWWDESDGGLDRTLAKYQLLLSFAGEPRLRRGEEPYQSAADVLVLRNAIVHYKPATVYADAAHRHERRLRGRFVANRLLPRDDGPWWPHGALGFGCASWAIASAEALADRVVGQVGIIPSYQRLLRGLRP